ncbi:MAG: hypothetical protein M3014_10505 [Chloroflexota bacterium]|nr:hypothetical protein [Chloroflexota bacterium]
MLSSRTALARQSLTGTLRSVLYGLRAPGFWLLLLGGFVLLCVVYQYKTTYRVDVGGLTDDGYVHGFFDKEHTPDPNGGQAPLTYRWTSDQATVRFPGIGSEPVVLSLSTIGHARPGDPRVTVQARGQSFTLKGTPPGLHSESFVLGRGSASNGDLEVTITSPVFATPPDVRDLGLLVDSVAVEPAGAGLRPFVVPPIATLARLFGGLILLYVTMLVCLRRRDYATVVTACLLPILALMVIFARMELGLLAEEVPALCAWGLLLGLLSRLGLDMLLAGTERHAEFAIAAGSMAFVAAFLLRYGGLIYPQFRTSDLLFHIHNMQSVLDGRWVFPGELPDRTSVPYPPAYYVIIAPFTLIFGRGEEAISLLLKWSSSLLDALSCFGLAAAGTRLWGARAGGLAALLYVGLPAAFDLFSAGNYSNLFGQSVFNLTALAALPFLAHGGPLSKRAVAVLAGGFFLTMVGHYGMMLAALTIVGLFTICILIAGFRSARSIASMALLGGVGVALLGSVLLYYRFFSKEMWDQISGIVSRLSSPGGPAANRRAAPSNGVLTGLGRSASRLLGIDALLLACTGLLLPAGRKGWEWRAWLLCWLAASSIFALLEQALGDSIRWTYLGAAAVALVAGRVLGLFSIRGRAAKTLVGLALLAVLWHTLQWWAGDLLFLRYHSAP